MVGRAGVHVGVVEQRHGLPQGVQVAPRRRAVAGHGELGQLGLVGRRAGHLLEDLLRGGAGAGDPVGVAVGADRQDGRPGRAPRVAPDGREPAQVHGAGHDLHALGGEQRVVGHHARGDGLGVVARRGPCHADAVVGPVAVGPTHLQHRSVRRGGDVAEPRLGRGVEQLDPPRRPTAQRGAGTSLVQGRDRGQRRAGAGGAELEHEEVVADLGVRLQPPTSAGHGPGGVRPAVGREHQGGGGPASQVGQGGGQVRDARLGADDQAGRRRARRRDVAPPRPVEADRLGVVRERQESLVRDSVLDVPARVVGRVHEVASKRVVGARGVPSAP